MMLFFAEGAVKACISKRKINSRCSHPEIMINIPTSVIQNNNNSYNNDNDDNNINNNNNNNNNDNNNSKEKSWEEKKM